MGCRWRLVNGRVGELLSSTATQAPVPSPDRGPFCMGRHTVSQLAFTDTVWTPYPRERTMIGSSRGISRSPTHLLHQAEQAAGKLFAATAMGTTTPRQLAVLIAVSENEGLNQTAVVKRTGIDRSTSADIIRRLVRKGLLQRRRSREDTRAKVLHLTDEGRQLLDAAGPVATNVDGLLLAALPAAERKPFLDALQAIAKSLEAAR
jgi:MarR family transcriptional regulator, temperature-dependent positive regulator of motility